jgi:hypothetical protein
MGPAGAELAGGGLFAAVAAGAGVGLGGGTTGEGDPKPPGTPGGCPNPLGCPASVPDDGVAVRDGAGAAVGNPPSGFAMPPPGVPADTGDEAGEKGAGGAVVAGGALATARGGGGLAPHPPTAIVTAATIKKTQARVCHPNRSIITVFSRGMVLFTHSFDSQRE